VNVPTPPPASEPAPAAATPSAPPAAGTAPQPSVDQTKTEPPKPDTSNTEVVAQAESPAAATPPKAETAPAPSDATTNTAPTEATPAQEPAKVATNEDTALVQSLPQADSLTVGQRVIHVWFGDTGTDDSARRAFDGDGGVKHKFAPLLDSYALEVRRFVIKDAVYRIYVGPVESLEKAQQLCAQVKQRDSGQKCQPVIN
jgi:hypothetical protein